MRRFLLYLTSLIAWLPISACLSSGGNSQYAGLEKDLMEIINSLDDIADAEDAADAKEADYVDYGSKTEEQESYTPQESNKKIKKNGSYTDKEHVALYLHTYGHLPPNYITKREAEKLGWVSSRGNLNDVAPGKSIGGDNFGNYEGRLPKKKGRKYFECDIGYKSGRRNALRIIYSNDGLVYYTDDHYQTFEQLY